MQDFGLKVPVEGFVLLFMHVHVWCYRVVLSLKSCTYTDRACDFLVPAGSLQQGPI